MAKSRNYTDGEIAFKVPEGGCCPNEGKNLLSVAVPQEVVSLEQWLGEPLNGYTEQQLTDVGLSVYVAPAPEPHVPTKEEYIQRIAWAGKQKIEENIDPDGMIMITEMCSYEPPNEKALACKQWLLGLRLEQYTRMGQIEAGLPWAEGDDDFSSFGDKPFTIEQLMMEYQG